MKQIKKLPRDVKVLPVCHILEEKLREFKDSIPLFSDLKNEALRERYFFCILVTFKTLSYTLELKHVMRCAIWYHLYNLKNVKNTQEECFF